MKIIDLLNKIANGEEVPNFWWNGCIHKVEKDINGEYNIFDTYCKKYKNIYLEDLNDEIEILKEVEEDEFIDIDSYIGNVGRVDESNIEEYIHILFNQQSTLIQNQKKIIEQLKKD